MEEHMDEQHMVEHDMNEQDMNEQPEPQPPRKKRGIYTINKKNRKQLNGVTFDEYGPDKMVSGRLLNPVHGKSL